MLNKRRTPAATLESIPPDGLQQVANRGRKKTKGRESKVVQTSMFEATEPLKTSPSPKTDTVSRPKRREFVPKPNKPDYYPQKANHSKRKQRLERLDLKLLEEILETLNFKPLVNALDAYRWMGDRYRGRRGYPPDAMLRLYFAKHILNISFDVKLLNHVAQSPELRRICRLGDVVPSATALSRFRKKLTTMLSLLDDCKNDLLDKIRPLLPATKKRPGKPEEALPPLGEVVAVDTTVVKSWANGNNGKGMRAHIPLADHDAKWGYKNSASSKKSEPVYVFGYRVHLIADASHELPLDYIVTPANASESTYLEPLLRQAITKLPWLKIRTFLGDRGYHGSDIFRMLWRMGIDPIIRIPEPTAKDGLYDGIYTKKGAPKCMGGKQMDYIQTDPTSFKHLFQCPAGGCQLKAKSGWNVKYCDISEWEDPVDNLRALGWKTARASKEWRRMYRKRWSIERVNKQLKSSRGLEDHRQRGLARIELLTATSVLTLLGTVLARLRRGDYRHMRRMKLEVT